MKERLGELIENKFNLQKYKMKNSKININTIYI